MTYGEAAPVSNGGLIIKICKLDTTTCNLAIYNFYKVDLLCICIF